MGQISIKEVFPGTISFKAFESNSSLHVKQRTTGKVQLLFSEAFLLLLAKVLFCQGDWKLAYHSIKLEQFLNFSYFCKIIILTQQFLRQLRYTKFISNNRTSLHFWCKENLVKHQRVWKYYENDCLQNFLSYFTSLLRPKFPKNSRIQARNYSIFLKNVLKVT